MPNKFQQKDMTGSMFLISPKESDKHPDFNGTVLIQGREYWISGWKKTAKSGKKFLSIAVTPKVAKAQAPNSQSNDSW